MSLSPSINASGYLTFSEKDFLNPISGECLRKVVDIGLSSAVRKVTLFALALLGTLIAGTLSFIDPVGVFIISGYSLFMLVLQIREYTHYRGQVDLANKCITKS